LRSATFSGTGMHAPTPAPAPTPTPAPAPAPARACRLSACVQLRGLDLLCVGGSDHQLHVYSVGRGRVMQSLPAHHDALMCLALAPRALLSGGADAAVLQWALTSTGVVPTPLRTLGAHAAAVLCCCCSGGGSDGGGGGPRTLEAGSLLVASGASDGTVALWDARAREACVWRAAAHQDACTGVGIVDDSWLVSCARDGSVAASHIGGGRQRLLRAAGGGPAQRCLQAVGGTALTAGDGGTSYIWDLRAMQLGGTLQVADGLPVHALHVHCEEGEARGLLFGLADGAVETWGAGHR